MAEFTIPQFRIDFPEFADTTKYPTTMITFWSNLADKLLDQTRWDNLGIRIEGLSLLTAHYITLAAMSATGVIAGMNPGQSFGLISQESVGGVNVSFDNSIGSVGESAGLFNLTSYGRQFWSLASIIGMGGALV